MQKNGQSLVTFVNEGLIEVVHKDRPPEETIKAIYIYTHLNICVYIFRVYVSSFALSLPWPVPAAEFVSFVRIYNVYICGKRIYL